MQRFSGRIPAGDEASTRFPVSAAVASKVFDTERRQLMATSTRRATAAGEAHGGDSPVRQFVGFRLGDEDYAIAITKIQEIILMKPITRLPQVPDAIEGLINLRGNVIPIVNLRKRFGLPSREFDDETAHSRGKHA